MRRSRVHHSLIWATLAVAWLAFNPFFGFSQSPETQAVDRVPPPELPPASAHREPSLPATIVIPKIGVTAHVQQVGNDKQGNVGIPTNFTDVAWYNRGPLPGTPGAALIVGHVNDRFAAPAVFAQLKDLVPGDQILVTDDRGQEWVFEVEEQTTYPYKNFPEEKIFGPYPDPRLHLITCTGTWIQAERSYDQRLIVFAKLVSAD